MRVARTLIVTGIAVLIAGCTDIVSRGAGEIAVAVPSAYKIDNARIRADRYCERYGARHAELVRTEELSRSNVAYFECR